MIRRLEIENFFSFRDPVALDLTVQPKAGDREVFADDPAGGRVNRILAVFGANASGKTQWLKALAFLRWLILESAQVSPEVEIPIRPFLFDDAKAKSPSRLAMEFSVGVSLYRYEVEILEGHIHHEALKVKKARWNTVFARLWNGDAFLISSSTAAGWRDLPRRTNASLLSWALLKELEAAKEIGAFFKNICTNVSHGGRNQSFDPQSRALFEAAQFFDAHPEHLAWVNQRLAHFDLGLSKVEITKSKILSPDGTEREIPLPVGLHAVQPDGTFPPVQQAMPDGSRREVPVSHVRDIPLFEESRGTQALFILLRYLLPVLESGGVAVLDEFETGLHSHMLPVLVDLFLGKHNPKGAQLVFSCHSDYLLTHLEKYQVALTGKDEAGASRIWRADDTGVRTQQNLYAKYHAGELGGVPAF